MDTRVHRLGALPVVLLLLLRVVPEERRRRYDLRRDSERLLRGNARERVVEVPPTVTPHIVLVIVHVRVDLDVVDQPASGSGGSRLDLLESVGAVDDGVQTLPGDPNFGSTLSHT
jgi:hypothetical protein